MNLEADRVVDFSLQLPEPYSGMSMRLKKVCPQCDATLHARKLACPCGHVFVHFFNNNGQLNISNRHSPQQVSILIPSVQCTIPLHVYDMLLSISHFARVQLCRGFCTLVLFIMSVMVVWS